MIPDMIESINQESELNFQTIKRYHIHSIRPENITTQDLDQSETIRSGIIHQVVNSLVNIVSEPIFHILKILR